MALAAEREAYLRLATHSMERSEQIAPNLNVRSAKAYGGYVHQPNNNSATLYEPHRHGYMNGNHSIGSNGYSPSSSSHPTHQHLSDTNLYKKNLPQDYSDQDLAKLVEGCGKVKSMKAIIDKQTNKCKGFGFIDFETTEDAKAAIAQLQKKGYVAQLAKSNQQQEQDTTNLYFANLDPQMTEQDLRQALSQHGNVISVRILRDQNKVSRGVGFARMGDRDQCQAIINRFHNQSFPDFSDRQVHVKFADASNKNKKLYKSPHDDMKSGPPLYPIDQGVPYPGSTVIFPQWGPMTAASMVGPHNNAQQGQAPPPTIVSGPPPHGHHHGHPMYQQAPPLRPPIGVFNPAIPPFMPLSHGPGPEASTALFLPMQQLHITNGPPGTFCLVNTPMPHGHPHAHAHPPTMYMPAPQPTASVQAQAQAQVQSQATPQSAVPPTSQHDPSLVASQDLS